MPDSVPQLRKSLKGSAPGLSVEKLLWGDGYPIVAGVDEVGKGSWAGPLTVGIAVVPKQPRLYKVRDSKQLKEAEREAIFDRLKSWCDAWAVGHASAAECDDLGMSEAQRLAVRRGLARLGCEPDAVILDGKWDFVGHPVTKKLVKADSISLSVAAASILAKVTRDRIMRKLDGKFPGYNFASNKGYPCPTHRAAVLEAGPSQIHRVSWAFMDKVPLDLRDPKRVEIFSRVE